MSNRCSHGIRVGWCDTCADNDDRTERLAKQVAEHLREMLPGMLAGSFRCCCTDRIGPHA